jgi:2-oxo-4-hydroxy-4-carboxy-5-ureidoimidazoline decarboxylase
MDTQEFISRYGGIYEHSPWVAEQLAELASDAVADTDAMARLMADVVDNAGEEQQLALIRSHPDLADKAQVVDELTPDSKAEQMSAGLHRCSKVEYERFQALNEAYKEKFGFPFVMAVRGSNCDDILGEFSRRLRNDHDVEFETALAEIHKIARFRLEALEEDA